MLGGNSHGQPVARALDLSTNLKPGEGTLEAYHVIRKAISHPEKDSILSKDIAAMKELIHSAKILRAVEKGLASLTEAGYTDFQTGQLQVQTCPGFLLAYERVA